MSTTAADVTLEEALQYDQESLENGLVKCEANIKIFEDAIANERNTIERYKKMITLIEVHQQMKQ